MPWRKTIVRSVPAIVVDDEPGLESSLSWSSIPPGVTGTGPSVDVSSLAPGSYDVTAEVTDSDSLTGSDTITVTVTPSSGVVEVRVATRSSASWGSTWASART